MSKKNEKPVNWPSKKPGKGSGGKRDNNPPKSKFFPLESSGSLFY